MWINRKAWEADQRQNENARLDAIELLRDADQRTREERKRHDDAIQLVWRLQQRLIGAEGAARAAQARADHMTVQINKLQDERDQLLAKVLNPGHTVEIRTPSIGRPVVASPGALFEDVGDVASEGGHYREPEDDQLTPEESVGGVAGQAWDPAQGLGISHPLE